MTFTSTIYYNREKPHIMKMVWEEWLKENDDLPDNVINELYDKWLTGTSTDGVTCGLIIPQKVWSRIVATYL